MTQEEHLLDRVSLLMSSIHRKNIQSCHLASIIMLACSGALDLNVSNKNLDNVKTTSIVQFVMFKTYT